MTDTEARAALTEDDREVLTRMKLDIDAHRWDAYRPEDVSVLLDIIVTLDSRLAALPDDGREKGPPSDVEGGPAGATGAVSVQGDSTPDDGRQGLDELRALSDAATPGPWTHGRTNWRRQRTDWWGIFPPRRIGTLPMFSLPPRPIVYLEDEELDQADAAFIVGAVNYVRSLIPADKP